MNTSAFPNTIYPVSAVLDPSVSFDQYMAIDLSLTNPEISKMKESSSSDWEDFIQEKLSENGKQIAYGGYLEKRNLYQRSAYFNNSENERDIHLGVDFWSVEGTSVHAFTDGLIHSFQDNKNHGDYGPTILIEHYFDSKKFYTLYGHLSRKSLEHISIGQKVKGGEKIAALGDASVNGDYAPHLHFQIIVDLEGNSGDYPGVCSEEELELYSNNCPNPIPFLRIPK